MYDEAVPYADKIINANGSVVSLSGITGEGFSQEYDDAVPFANKWLFADGTIGELSISGGSAFTFKGELANLAAIQSVMSPASGDIYRAADSGIYYAYSDTGWVVTNDALTASLDGYYTKTAVDSQMAATLSSANQYTDDHSGGGGGGMTKAEVQALIDEGDAATLGTAEAYTDSQLTNYPTSQYVLDNYVTRDEANGTYTTYMYADSHYASTDALNAVNDVKLLTTAEGLAAAPGTVFVNSETGWLYYVNDVTGSVVGVAGQNTVSKLQQQINTLTATVLALNARMDNKVLDPANKQDIEAASQGAGWTAPENTGLGWQITGAGVNALLANTGLVTVNGETVFDNRGALGLELGEEPMTPYDINDGDIVVSSGMANLYATPYIPGN